MINIPVRCIRIKVTISCIYCSIYISHWMFIAIIDKILNYETLGTRYKANLADYVKDEFNKDT